MSRLFGRLLAILAVSLATATPGLTALAAQEGTPSPETPQFGLAPSGEIGSGYFDLSLDPGASVSLVAQLNNSGIAVDLRAFVANVSNPPNGGFAAGEEDEELTGTSLWVDFAAESFSMEPGTSRDLAFTVTVPADAAPGQYITSLVVRTQEAVPIAGTTAFDQVIRSAIPILITVPGPVSPSFEIGEPGFNIESDNRLVVPIVNTGNVLVKPGGTLTVTTPDGEPVVSAPVQMDSVYAGFTSSIMIGLPDQLTPGPYLVSLDLADQATGASASIDAVEIELPDRDAPPPAFVIDPITITANGSPIQFADVAVTITNAGSPIPTANVTLKVMRDGEPVEDYPLAQNQALLTGDTTVSQRYLPATGWQSGTYTFQVEVASVNDGVQTVLITADATDTIVVP